MIKIAINGFGRIGRLAFRNILDSHPKLQIVAINDLTDPKTLAYLLKYDSNYGTYKRSIDYDVENIIVDKKKYKVFSEKDPENLPWQKLGVDAVLECTGFYTDRAGAEKHLKAGAKKVVISAPAKSDDVKTLIFGVNEKNYNRKKDNIISNGSCTTNCLAPLAKILNDNFGIINGFVSTVHGYTNDQRILDLPHKDLRRARSATQSIIPTTTGAAKSVIAAIPELKGKINGGAFRVPVAVVSIAEIVAVIKLNTTVEDVNDLFRKMAKGTMKRILGVSEEPLVSVDFKGNPLSSIVDAPLTAVNGNMIKVSSWYDNEWGYTCRLVEMAEYIAK